jgi:uncharacterized DUF497 family protein
MEFEWDPAKATTNVEKHCVAFSDAMTIFSDPLEVTIPDPNHLGPCGDFDGTEDR